MSDFRERMKVAVSQAEVDLQIALRERGLDRTCWYQKDICLHKCTPDFYFDSTRLCVFLDGPPHDKAGALNRDANIDELLRKRGYRVARFRHNGGKLSKQRLALICNEIERRIK